MHEAAGTLSRHSVHALTDALALAVARGGMQHGEPDYMQGKLENRILQRKACGGVQGRAVPVTRLPGHKHRVPCQGPWPQ